MEFTLSKNKAERVKASLMVVASGTAKPKSASSLQRLDKAIGGSLAKILTREKFKGKVGEAKLIHTHGQVPCDAVLVLGTTSKNEGDLPPNELEQVRRAAGRAAKAADSRKSKSMAIDLSGWPRGRFSEADKVQAAVEGVLLALYRFTRYRKGEAAQAPSLKQVEIISSVAPAAGRRAIKVGTAIATGTNHARDLINTPAHDMAPQDMARHAKQLKAPIRIRVYTLREIEKMGMGSYLAVARGSDRPPAFIHMSYKPTAKTRKTVAVVGKGVTFDSGGLSLKPPGSMETMKDDMSGAAAVIGIMQAVAALRPRVNVHGIIAATENMPSGKAVKPGDVAKAMNGKTIEILNTDAEGRLTLADAMQFAIKKKPDVVIDMATLTGACLVALGERCAGLMGNDSKLLKSLQEASNYSGEMLWQLPLIDEYVDDLKSPIADLKNIGGRWGGTIEAGLFLREFAEGVRWAHIDIAGPSWANKPLPYIPKGGTGCMVSTITNFLLNY